MFPEYKIEKGWFFDTKIPDGWEDLGESQIYTRAIGNQILGYKDLCHFCHSRIRIGKEGNKRFKFCPLCLRSYDE